MLALRCKSKWGNWRKTQGQSMNYTKFGKRHRKKTDHYFQHLWFLLVCWFVFLLDWHMQSNSTITAWFYWKLLGTFYFMLDFFFFFWYFFITFQQKNTTMFPEMRSVLVGGRSVKFHSQVAYFCVCISLSACGVGHVLSVQPWGLDGNYFVFFFSFLILLFLPPGGYYRSLYI